ncbi:hypothetical protein PRZ48_013416 [Zasmidium cellare]|uniref:Uncharacterized protein n=1 Tax=Zasmidium cellare TaxID=395010 RepID=A0ABR0E1A1_ZASCE|nr:hypothetical protein PRZ48_013416 [Zasmidium cellare]
MASNMADEKTGAVVAEPTIMAPTPASLPDEEKTVGGVSPASSTSSTSPPFTSPYDWPLARKIAIALIVSFTQLVAAMSASMMAAALPAIGRDLHMGATEIQVSFSIYLLGLAFGPFIVGPASEICGIALTQPIVADMFTKENRGKSIALATVFPYLGPALGPIVGGVVSQKVSWPWLFWVLSIFDGAVLIVGVIVIRESYMPVLLRRHQRKAEGLKREPFLSTYPELFRRARTALALPIRLLFTRPIILIISFVMGLEFGVYILWLSVYATLFIDKYHETPTISSLHYIAIAIGAWLAAQVGGQVTDIIFKKMKARRPDEEAPPEYRVPLLAIGVLICPIGLFWAGWSAQSGIHWIMVDLGSAIFTIGSFVTGQAVIAYLLDEFQKSAASANAAARMLSNLFGFAFPLFAPQLYVSLGYGWGTTLLALIWIVLAVPLTVMLWFRGAKVRAIGRREENRV